MTSGNINNENYSSAAVEEQGNKRKKLGGSPPTVEMTSERAKATFKFQDWLLSTNTTSVKALEKALEKAPEKALPMAQVKVVAPMKKEATLVPQPINSSGSSEQSISYSELCELFDKVASTTKRLEKIDYCVKWFKKVMEDRPSELLTVVYLSINVLGPSYLAPELGIGESLIIKALAGATGGSVAGIKSDFEREGDLGTVAINRKSKQASLLGFKPKPLTIEYVFKSLCKIGNMSGQSSQLRKVDMIRAMLAACQGSELKYLVRSLENKLRIGLAEQTILIALAHAKMMVTLGKDSLSSEEANVAAETVKEVFMQCPNYDILINNLLEYDLSEIPERCRLTPGVPLKPMLAHPTKSLSEVLSRVENNTFTCEFKYDGERAQVHRTSDNKVYIFSRNSENLSPKYPDIVQHISSFCRDESASFVLDCEAVAWDLEQDKILPFQVLSTRKRKNVDASDIKIKVCLFAFDLLYYNGKPLLKNSLRERREILYSNFKPELGRFAFAVHRESSDIEDIQHFLDDAVAASCEGLMVKTLDNDATYEPSRRSRNWLKVKKDYLAGVGDTLDLVVIGAYTGKGKRTGVFGGFLLACYDPDSETYQSICKLGTGFSEDDLLRLSSELKQFLISAPKSYYSYSDTPNIKPDVWFDARLVWEIKAADLSLSPVHKAGIGLVDHNKGISLRFPRYLNSRPDKKAEDATSSQQAVEMYRSQQLNQMLVNKDKGEDENFEY